MSWTSILKQTALVGRDAKSPNIWLHRKATTRNLGRPMTSKPTNLSTIPVEVPTEKFEEYYSFFADFYSRGGWKMYSQGSLQQGITNDSVKRVLKDFERGNIKVDRKYSKGLDEVTEKALENTIEMMKKTAELLMVGSRSRIREGRDLMRYAEQLEESYDKGVINKGNYLSSNWMDILKRKWQGKLAANRKESLERNPSIKIKIPEMSYPKEEKEISKVLKVMKEKKLEPKEMKDADLKPDIEMFKIVGESRDDYEDFMLDVNHYAITEKMKYQRPRPFQVSDEIPTTKTTTDDTPAFPSGHAMLAYGLERILSGKFPNKKKQLKEMADRIALSRIQMGSHYPSDIEAGKKIGYMLGDEYE